MKKNRWARNLTAAEMREARELEAAGITTVSQAVKAFQERPERLAEFRAELAVNKAIEAEHDGEKKS